MISQNDVNFVDDNGISSIMSTKFTRLAVSSDAEVPMTVLLQTASEWIMRGLLAKLQRLGYQGITDSHMILFGNLDCGTTHAAAIAQRIGVSRQAIHRTLRELEQSGILILQSDPLRRNQNLVVMTDAGKRLALDARAGLAEVELLLGQRIGTAAAKALRDALQAPWGSTLDD
jgi:DNA-binding MarR family transcriptional regulator